MPTPPITALTLAELMVDKDATIYRNAMSIFKRLKARERAEAEEDCKCYRMGFHDGVNPQCECDCHI